MSTIIEEKAIQEGTRVAYAGDLSVINCSVCGGTYALSKRFLQCRREDSESWTCPYCRNWISYHKSETDKLRDQLEKQKNMTAYQQREKEKYLNQRDSIKRSHSSMKGVVTRQRNKLARVKKGVCPCCNRYFKNLHKHIKGQHPDWKKEN